MTARIRDGGGLSVDVTPRCDRDAMTERFARIAALAADQHGVVSARQLASLGVDSSLRSKWRGRALLEQVGERTFALAGSTPTWQRSLSAAVLDADGHGIIAGRAGGRLLRLDGFPGDDVELLVSRSRRNLSVRGVARTSTRPMGPTDVITVDGFRTLTAERLILESPLFRFSRAETENAIDSAIRLRLVSEQRLRTRVIAQHNGGVNGSRQLLDALVDTGGESRLERWCLQLIRSAGLPRPQLRTTFRDGARTIARVDMCFPGGLIVEVAGHGTHASRRQRQQDEQRRTELTLRGHRVITFTYDDVRDRPEWVVARLRQALASAA